MIDDHVFEQLVQNLSDDEVSVRNAVYKCLLQSTHFQCTRDALVAAGSVLPTVFSFVMVEDTQRAIWGLKILINCTQVRGEILQHQAVFVYNTSHERY